MYYIFGLDSLATDEPDPYTCPLCEGPTDIDGTCDCIDDSDRNYLHPKNKLRYNKILTLYGFKRTRLPNEGKE